MADLEATIRDAIAPSMDAIKHLVAELRTDLATANARIATLTAERDATRAEAAERMEERDALRKVVAVWRDRGSVDSIDLNEALSGAALHGGSDFDGCMPTELGLRAFPDLVP